jgi:CubicO group peptidase (beta-lactamase class C family)
MNLSTVSDIFNEQLSSGRDLGASLSVWKDGREILSLAGGFRDRQKTLPWTESSPVLFWSATKGLAAACLLRVCQDRGIALSRRVAEFWPEFAAAGKGSVTLAELLSHRAGLAALSREASVLDHQDVVEALAAEAPHWELGAGHGYHPRTFGFLLDELVRRMTGGISLGQFWQTTFAQPLDLELWIGIEPDQVDKIAPVFPAKSAPPKEDRFYAAFGSPESLTARAFGSPRGLHSVASMNTAEARTAALPAFGGIGTASALAKFYAMLANGGSLGGKTFFAPETLALMATTLTQGPDLILQMETAFSAGFMRDPIGANGLKQRTLFGPSLRAFGHPGAGGSHAFADPENRIGFAYVMNQMEPGVLPNQKSLALISALYGF